MSEEIEFLIICKRCCETQAATRVESSNGSPTSPLLLQGRDFPNPATATKHGKLVGCKGSSASFETLEHSSEVKSTNRSAVTKKNRNLNWGLIWRKKNCEDTGIDFRFKNILLRGNTDRDLIKPLCHLCNQPYNADLMYIRCETCQHWFHADSVELDESKIFFLVGFKCCKCRRIKSPVCPYLDPEKKKVLEDQIERQQAAKLESSAMDFDCVIISDHPKEVGPAYSALPRKAEVFHVEADNSLLASLSEVKQCTEGKSSVNYGPKNATVSGPVPRKLPVRRHVNQEKDVFCQAGPFQFEVSAPFEANVLNSTKKMPVRRSIKRETNLNCYSATKSFRLEVSNLSEANAVSSVQDLLSSEAQRIASKENFDDGATLNSDCLGYDDTGFKPQTFFSSNELLESDNGGHANGTRKISYDQKKPIISVETANQIVPCKFCSNTEPCPDLSCQICDMWIHRICSPWFESSSREDDWRCGNCREWR